MNNNLRYPSDDDPEEWRWIPGQEGRYKVSSLGRVMSHIQPTPHLLSTRGLTVGYPTVTIRGSAEHPVSKYVHRLVLGAFVGPLPDGQVTRHLNGDKTDNRLVNLTYGTQVENAHDTLVHGATGHHRRTHCASGHDLSVVGIVRGTISACAECRDMRLDRETEYVRQKRGTLKPQRNRRKDLRVDRSAGTTA